MPTPDLFADKAQDWDALPLPQAISLGVRRALDARVTLADTMQVMDFGAGTGLVTATVAPHVAKVWAVDVSASMLDRLAAKPTLAGQVEVLCRDLVTEPLGARFHGHFDLIVSAMALHHVADTQTLLRRFAEGLKPGGQVALADLDAEDGSFHPPGIEGVFHHGFERDALAAALTDAGFEQARFDTALEVEREGRRYPIFLVTARRAAGTSADRG